MTDKCDKCRWRVAYPKQMCMLRISNKQAQCNFKPIFRASLEKKDRRIEAKGA